MNLNLIKRNCPSCNEISKNNPEIFPATDPINNNEIIIKNWSGFYRNRVFFPYYRCNCGLLYNKIYLDNLSLSSLYENQKDNVIYDNLSLDLKTKKYYLNILFDELKNKKKDIKILELGADNGNFLNILRTALPNSELYAIEPNKNMRQNLLKLTNNIFENINELPDDQKFDLIVGIHVFDHIPKLNDYINLLGKKLNINGYIFGVVHNEKSILSRILKNRWPPYTLQHPHLFNHNSINNFFIRNNYKKIFIKRTKNFFYVGFLMTQLFLSLFKIKISIPKFFSIGLKLGNFSFLYKKK
tara:strand:+ start:805 stop:1701 length:897 start_codon:yes stop_codon:yes gene_type:complete